MRHKKLKNRDLRNKMISLFLVVFLVGICFWPQVTGVALVNKKTDYTSPLSIEKQRSYDKVGEILERINTTMVTDFLLGLVELGPRETGTFGCLQAGEHVFNLFQQMNLSVRYDYWQSLGNLWNRGFYRDRNVEATHYGTNEESNVTILFNAHFDTTEGSVGADDDASGMAALLTAAYVLSQYDFEHTLRFVAFSGEEVGLIGSSEYAKEIHRNNEQITVEINADVIGHTKTAKGGHQARLSSTNAAKWVANVVDNISTQYHLDLEVHHHNINVVGTGGSDYRSFVDYGYDAIAFWEYEFNPWMNSPADTLEHVNFSYLTNMTKLIVGTMAKLADLPTRYPQVKIVSPEEGSLYFDGRKQLISLPKGKTILMDNIRIWATVDAGPYQVSKVEFYIDDELLHTDTTYPYTWSFDKHLFRTHTLSVKAYDEAGNSNIDEMDLTVINTRYNI